MRISDWSSDVCSSDLCRSGGSRELFAPSPAKAGEGWGGVLSGSRRTVATPSQPPPAVAGGGAKAKARGFRRSYQSPITAPSSSHARRTRCARSEEHTSELQSLMRISYAVFCLKKKTKKSRSEPNEHIIIST